MHVDSVIHSCYSVASMFVVAWLVVARY